MNDAELLAAKLRRFAERKEVIKQLRSEIKRPVPVVVRRVRQAATTQLPHGGGLNKWTAAARMASTVKVGGSSIKVTIRGSKSGHDLKAIDKGRARHPTFGHRGKWHTTLVEPGFFTDTIENGSDDWREVIADAIEAALRTVRG